MFAPVILNPDLAFRFGRIRVYTQSLAVAFTCHDVFIKERGRKKESNGITGHRFNQRNCTMQVFFKQLIHVNSLGILDTAYASMQTHKYQLPHTEMKVIS